MSERYMVQPCQADHSKTFVLVDTNDNAKCLIRSFDNSEHDRHFLQISANALNKLDAPATNFSMLSSMIEDEFPHLNVPVVDWYVAHVLWPHVEAAIEACKP